MGGSYLEPDRDGYEDSDDEGGISLTAIKNKYKRGGPRGIITSFTPFSPIVSALQSIICVIFLSVDARPPIYSSEEDASDIEDRKAKKQERPKALRDSDEDEAEAGGSGTNKVRVVSSSEEDSD